VCGLNPSVVAADAGFGYAGATNRFWKAAVAAGLVSRMRDPWHALAVDHVGMTDLVKRATPRSSELARDEYRAGAARVARLVEWLQPEVGLFVGLDGLAGGRDAVELPRMRTGSGPSRDDPVARGEDLLDSPMALDAFLVDLDGLHHPGRPMSGRDLGIVHDVVIGEELRREIVLALV